MTTKFLIPPDDGGKIDSLANLQILANNFNCTLFYIGEKREGDDLQKRGIRLSGVYCFPKEVENHFPGLIKNIFSRFPYTIGKYYDRRIYLEIESIIKEKKIEIVFIDHLHMAMYGKAIKKQFPKMKLILREHNVETVFWHRIYREEKNPFKKLTFWWQYLKVLSYERGITGLFDQCFMISSVDEGNLKKMNPSVKTKVIPTGININNYQLSASGGMIPFSMLFIGDFSWAPNLKGILWFLSQVWPETKKQLPKAKLFIVGKKPSSTLLNHQNDDIIIPGYVKEIQSWFEKSELFLVPLFSGGGIRIKILEAMAMGKPIISTPVGAEGIEVEHKKNIFIARNAQEFIASIKLLFHNREVCNQIAGNAAELIGKKYAFPAIEKNIRTIMHDL